MTCIEINKIARLFDYKIELSDGFKGYTWANALEFATKFAYKYYPPHDESEAVEYEYKMVKLLMFKNILVRIYPDLHYPTSDITRVDNMLSFIRAHYSRAVYDFVVRVLNIPKNEMGTWSTAYDLLQTFDDWIAVYEFIMFGQIAWLAQIAQTVD